MRPGRDCSRPIRNWRWCWRLAIRSGSPRLPRCSIRSGFTWVNRSDWQKRKPAERDSQPLQSGQIVLLDTIGELASVYSLAAVAFVGGSLVPAGGHNPLEPAQFGVPIVMGPHYANFRAITEDLLAHDAIRIAAKDELAEALIELLSDRTGSRSHGRARPPGLRAAGRRDGALRARR